MLAFFSTFLITLGVGQIISAVQGWRAASLVGASRATGFGVGALLMVGGALFLPQNWTALVWTLVTGPLALAVLLVGGAYIAPPPHPNRLFDPVQPTHAGCRAVQIPDGDYLMPGWLLHPLPELAQTGTAVCIVPGAGDHKSSFKWRLVTALLAEGLTVLTIDPPGHGDYRQRPLTYPDCLSAVPAAIEFLRRQPGVERVGVAGISLGGALAIGSLVEPAVAGKGACSQVEALVVLETPVSLNYNRALVFRELWAAGRAPVLSLLREISFQQIIQSWRSGGYRSPHRTGELIELLSPVQHIARIENIPILLVYSDRDPIAPPAAAVAMRRAAPQSDLLTSQTASHVTLTLQPEINGSVARWLRQHLTNHPSSQLTINNESNRRA